MIELSNISIGFGRKSLVEKADARFVEGEMVALIGRNGSGKSTLLRTMAGLNRGYKGEILIDGDSHLIDRPERARTVAFVNTSRVRIANMLCRDVVALGRAPYTNWIGMMRPEDKKIVAESLASVGMSGYEMRPIDTLSDGESQRIMIARALAQDTKVILLDEPTSFLDVPNRYLLMDLLASLAHTQNKCVILSTHELDIALKKSDRIALIDTPHLKILDARSEDTRDEISRAFRLTDIR